MGSSFGPEGPDATREGADLDRAGFGRFDQHDRRQGQRPEPARRHHRRPYCGPEPPGRDPGGAVPREHTGRGQLVETSLLGGQIWAQAGEYTRYLMTGQISGPANRGHPMIPGIYAIFRTRDGWIAIVGVAGPARDLFFETIGRPDLIERFGQLLYFEEDKAELFPILDDVFATKSTAEWCGLLTAAGLRFAPVRDHAEVVADPGVWVNGYVAERKDPEAPPGSDHPVVRPPVRFSQATPEPETQVPRTGTAHRGGPAPGGLFVGRDRCAVNGACHLNAT